MFVSKSKRSRKRPSPVSYQTLEPRRCLAGNINVILDGTVLLLVGDSSSNEVELTQNTDGSVLITGVDTTINGSSDPFTVAGSVHHVTAALNDGDDTVSVNGLHVPRSFNFFGANGNDRLNADGLRTRYIHVNSGEGDDTLDLIDVYSTKSTYLYLGNGDDTVAIHSLTAGRNFKLFGDGGNDSLISNTLLVGRKMKINMSWGDDTAIFTGRTHVGKRARINLNAGNDSVEFNTNGSGESIRIRRLQITGNQGDDTVVIDGNTTFRSRAKFNGSGGNDALVIGDQVNGRHKDSSFESNTGNLNSIKDALFAALRGQNIDTTDFGDTTERTLDVTTTQSNLEYTEGADPVALDDGITLSSGFPLEITQARVTLANFDADQDEIAFADTSSIQGQFDDTTGTLTLTGTASIADYQAALRSVTYENTSQSPLSDDRTITFEVDSIGQTFEGSRTLAVSPVNSAPVVELSVTEVNANFDQLPIALDSNVKVSDVDDDVFPSATVSIIEGYVNGDDSLSFTAVDNVQGSFDADTGTLTFTGSMTPDELMESLRSVTFNHTASDPVASDRTLRFTVSDGDDTHSAELKLTLEVASST